MLKYLFTAHYKDGTTIEQTQEDASVTGKGSAFTDVLAKKGITLFDITDGDNSASVDLISGEFTVNGAVLNLHEQYFNPEEHKLRLIYFRETIVERVQTGETTEDRHYVNRYFIGWQCTDKEGKNHKALMAVK